MAKFCDVIDILTGRMISDEWLTQPPIRIDLISPKLRNSSVSPAKPKNPKEVIIRASWIPAQHAIWLRNSLQLLITYRIHVRKKYEECKFTLTSFHLYLEMDCFQNCNATRMRDLLFSDVWLCKMPKTSQNITKMNSFSRCIVEIWQYKSFAISGDDYAKPSSLPLLVHACNRIPSAILKPWRIKLWVLVAYNVNATLFYSRVFVYRKYSLAFIRTLI